MNSSFQKRLDAIKKFWESMSRKNKILLIVIIAAAITGAIVADALLTQTKYELLYSGLTDQESGEIISDLQTRSISYKLQGNDIYVDSSVADKARMELAVDGYPSTTLNYSIYSSGSTWAMTDSDKKTLYQYQTQDRLQSTIETIPGVKNAIVTITQGNDDTYVLESDKESVTASVKLTLSNGYTLTSKQVTGIVNLVSHSVSGLSADNVTVEDSDGNTLNNADGSASGDTTEQLALQSEVENEVKEKVLSVLGSVYGTKNVKVSPAATIDFSQTTTDTTTYSGPNSGSGLPSEVSSSVTISGNGTTTSGGTVGVNETEPTYTTSGSSSTTTGTVTQESHDTSYLYNKVEQQVKDQGGSVKDLTIGVMLNSADSTVAGVNASDVQQFVAYAIGTTSDKVNVQFAKFASSSSSSGSGKSTKPSSTSSALGNLPILAAIGLAAVFLAVMLVFFILRGRRKKQQAEKARLLAEQLKEQVDAQKKKRPDLNKKLDDIPPDPVKEQIEDFADNKPELVAQLLRNWLKDN